MTDTKPTTIKDRVIKLETSYTFICEKLDKIQNNELVHINDKLDKIDDKFNCLDKKVGEMAVKVGIVFAIFTAIAETILRSIIK